MQSEARMVPKRHTPPKMSPLIAIPQQYTEEDFDEHDESRVAATRSPTDSILSPCSKKMLRKKQLPRQSSKKAYILEKNLTRRENPLETVCPLILGSSSRNRKALLDMLNWNFATMNPDIDEKAIRTDDSFELPCLIARAKASALFDRLKSSQSTPLVLLTCDQVVLFKGVVREKPVSREEAIEFLQSYSNETVTTVSAVVATHFPSGRQATEVDIAAVTWGEISPDIVTKVVDKGEIFSSAGGFRIEDEDLNPLIESIDGTMDSVMGMPIDSTVQVLLSVLEESDPDHSEIYDFKGFK